MFNYRTPLSAQDSTTLKQDSDEIRVKYPPPSRTTVSETASAEI